MPGDIMESENEIQDRLSVIVTGRADVRQHDRTVHELGAGHFAGKIAYLTDEAPSTSVVAVAPTRLVSWRKQDLRKFLKDKTELAAALNLILGVDLRASLEDAWRRQADGATPRP